MSFMDLNSQSFKAGVSIGRRYLQGSTQKIKRVAPTQLTPIVSVSTQINTTGLMGWTCFGLGLISFLTLGSLYLFQRVERTCWQNKNDEIIINVTVSLSD